MKKNTISITNVRLVPGDPKDAAEGLLGWASCVVNGTVRLDGMVVRRTLDGEHALSFPARFDLAGRKHFVFSPLNDAARREIERQVFEQLGFLREASTP